MIDIRELYWAAGFLEGEGWFGYKIQHTKSNYFVGTYKINAVQVQREPLERLQRLLGGKIWLIRRQNPKHNDIWSWEQWGVNALGAMYTLYTLMSPKRQDQIKQAIEKWKARPLAARYRTHCLRGHKLQPIKSKSSRQFCRECARRRSATWRLKKLGFGPNAKQMELLN